MKMSVMVFAGAMARSAEQEYNFVLEIAEIADRGGLEAIWLPERHFSQFGAPYPNPLLLLAAIATRTATLKLRAGSIVAPLHHVVRLAEDLSVLDNLTNGRIEVALASGWHPNDFVLAPSHYAARRDKVLETASTLDAIWQGQSIDLTNGVDDAVEIYIRPEPKRLELPIWLTVAQSSRTIEMAGAGGYDLLTHVLDPDLGRLAESIQLYRTSRERAGHDPASGRVALMLHAFLANDPQKAVATASGPYRNYLKSIAPMAAGLATARDRDVALDGLSQDKINHFVDHHFDRTLKSRSLIGSPSDCLETVRSMADIGVDEIVALVDFGLPGATVVDQLPSLIELNSMIN